MRTTMHPDAQQRQARAGELLKDLARATPSDAGKASGEARSNASNDATRSKSPYAETLARTGISRQMLTASPERSA